MPGKMPTIIPFDDNLFLKKCGENFQSPPSPLPPSSQMKWRGPFFCLHCRGHCRGHAETARVRNPSTFRHLLLRVICCPGRPIHHYSLCTLLCLSSPTSVHDRNAWIIHLSLPHLPCIAKAVTPDPTSPAYHLIASQASPCVHAASLRERERGEGGTIYLSVSWSLHWLQLGKQIGNVMGH
jgi:hypothetical protein